MRVPGPDEHVLQGLDSAAEGAAAVQGTASEIGRREFVTDAAAGVLAACLPALRPSTARAQSSCTPPPNFPSGIQIYQQGYQNWSQEIQISSLWTCAPQSPADVVTVVNWARNNGYKARPRGMMHNWSPLTVASSAGCSSNVVLLDTTQHLTAV